jgi:hypothetical protein
MTIAADSAARVRVFHCEIRLRACEIHVAWAPTAPGALQALSAARDDRAAAEAELRELLLTQALRLVHPRDWRLR